MSRFSNALLVATALLTATPAVAADRFPGIGRPATPAEVKAWDIDVRPDFAGLPKGSGSVEQGMEVWEGKCASCHGTFGESNKIFTPLIGGVEKGDLATGNVATLKRTDFPNRTTFMKVATISTIFDYVKRAMPWNAPKTLTDDQVYAVVAYMLNLAEIVPDNFVLNDQTIRDVQKIMPNRNGMDTNHAMWPSAAFTGKPVKPDVTATRCMKDCKKSVEIASALPDYALPSHGNIADQNRRIGPVRGQVTGPSAPAGGEKLGPLQLSENVGCVACHQPDTKTVGPSYQMISEKYKGQEVFAQLSQKIRAGGEGVWGDVAMPAQEVKDEDLKVLLEWILKGAPNK